MRLKVAIVSQSFTHDKPGGVPTYAEGRAAYLSRRCDVRIYALGSDTGQPRNFSIGQTANFRLRFLGVWISLLRQLMQWRPDVIEIHNIPIGLPLFLLKCPVSYFFHGPARLEAQIEGSSDAALLLKYRLERFCLRRSSKIYTVSRSFQKLLSEEHPLVLEKPRTPIVRYPKLGLATTKPARVAPSTVDNRLPFSLPIGSPVFFCVRRLVVRTGVDLLVKAFDQALSEGRLPSSAILLIAGFGPLETYLAELIAGLQHTANIKLLGRVDDSLRDILYNRVDYSIVPTIGLEGFGMVVLEAAFQGCPSIVTNVNALPEVINLLGGVGLVCEPSIASMMQALENACYSPPVDRLSLQRHALIKFAVLG